MSSRSQQIVDDARAVQGAQADGRLPTPDLVTWTTFPFEGGMVVKPVDDLVIPEPPRYGEGGTDCGICSRPDEECLWTDEHWRVRALPPTGLAVVLIVEPREHYDLGDLPPHLVDSMGRIVWRVERALSSLEGVARVHVARWGDGAEHLHLWFLPRPEGFVQGRGTFLAVWDEVLPTRPEHEWLATLDELRQALRASA